MLGRLAECYRNQQKFTDAERLYQTVLSLLKERPEENRQGIAASQPWRSWHSVYMHPQCCSFLAALNNLAVSYHSSGQTQKAIETCKEVLEVLRKDPETPSLSLSACRYNTLLSCQASFYFMLLL